MAFPLNNQVKFNTPSVGCYSLLLLTGFCLCTLPTQAQITLHFTINQPPALVADAGGDKTIHQGEKVQLGSTTTASGGKGDYTYQWTPSTGLDGTDTANPLAAPDTTITYTVIVTDANGCTETSQAVVTVDQPTGLESPLDPLGINVFPNPSPGLFTVTTNESISGGVLLIEVISPLGQTVYTEDIHDAHLGLKLSIDLSALGKGMYLFRFSGKTGSSIKKVVLY